MNLNGKTALITGASQGVGAATARLMASKGARVLLLARTEGKLNEVTQSIERAGGTAEVHPVDLSNPDATERLTTRIKAAGTVPDVIVNNAGAGRWLFIEETSLEEMQSYMALPYFAAFAVTKGFVAEMAARGSGSICNVNGPGAYFPWPGSIAYASARWALRGFSTALRVDLRDTDLTVSEVLMGKIESSYWENNPGSEERMPWIDRFIPALSSEQAGIVITRAVERERRLTTAPALYTACHLAGRVFPRLVHWSTYAGGAKRPIPALTPVERSSHHQRTEGSK